MNVARRPTIASLAAVYGRSPSLNGKQARILAKHRLGQKVPRHELHWARAALRVTGHPESLEARYRRRLTAIYAAEIAKRGGETGIEEKDGTVPLRIADSADGLVLLTAHGWRQYSKTFGARRAGIAYLCGRDDNGPWAVRVASTISSVADALHAITPAAVREARGRVLRQGDVYAIEVAPEHDAPQATEVGNHWWDRQTRRLMHYARDGRAHAPLHVPFPARFVAQNTRGMGRGGAYGVGD